MIVKKEKALKPFALGHSLTMNRGWRAHYEMSQRWFTRFMSASNREEKWDYLVVYFQHMAHMRDWLVVSKASTNVMIREFFEPYVEWKICLDFANMTKHASLSAPRAARGTTPSVVRIANKPGWFTQDSDLGIATGGKTYDLRDIGMKLNTLWLEYLTHHDLL